MEFMLEAARENVELAGQLKDVNGLIRQLEQEKGRVIDLYVSGDLLRDAYVMKSLAFDNKLNELKGANPFYSP
jgi:hypothetical protein